MVKKVFRTNSQHAQHNGQEVVATSPMPEAHYDREEVGPMFHATLANGATIEVFGDEIVTEPAIARSYVIGLPVTVTVHDDGRVEWEVDYTEASLAVSKGESDYARSIVDADVERIDQAPIAPSGRCGCPECALRQALGPAAPPAGRAHAAWGDDPSGYCGCPECEPEPTMPAILFHNEAAEHWAGCLDEHRYNALLTHLDGRTETVRILGRTTRESDGFYAVAYTPVDQDFAVVDDQDIRQAACDELASITIY